jgi:hypothetical protein
MWNNSGASAPPRYSITASSCHSIAHRALFRLQNHASPFNYAGRRRGGAMMSGPLVNDSSQTVAPFQFPFICFITWPRRHLQPSTLVATFNFNPRRHLIPLQLQSSLPTSSLVAANFNPLRLPISKPRHCAISSPFP